jgi:hypothetical protein
VTSGIGTGQFAVSSSAAHDRRRPIPPAAADSATLDQAKEMTMRELKALTVHPATRLALAAVPSMFGFGACAPQAVRDNRGLIAQSARWDEALNSGNLDDG